MATKWKVLEKEYNRWVKFLKNQGYSGPFAGLTTKHECVKLLEKELKRGTIPGTRPRDKRTIASNLTRYERGKGQPRLIKGGPETNVDAIVSVPGLERRHKTWILHEWLGLAEGKIVGKLGIPPKDVRHDIEVTGKELTSETKEEQESTVNLPPWVNQAQREHLEGREQRDEMGGGIDVITYPRGTGIRQELEFFKNSFSDINPRNQSFWVPKDEIVMAQLHGHLPDKAFWELIEGSEGFIKKAKECEALLDAAREKFASAGEELAPLQLVITGPVPDAYITSGWVRRVLVRALSRELGFREPDKYYPRELKDGDFILEDEETIYRGPDAVAAEQKHRELVKGFINSDEFSPIVNLMKDLRNLRQQIFTRIDQCLRGREYSYNYCPDCPADQARKMLASKEE